MTNDRLTTVIYHANCPDGITAAWVVRTCGPTDGPTGYHAATHGGDPPDVTGHDVIMVDFTYPPETMSRVAEQAATLLVLDHHQTAQRNCAPILDLPGVTVVLDDNRSGARLAWDHFAVGIPLPPVVHFVEDRDLWRFIDPRTKDYMAAVMSRPLTMDEISSIDRTPQFELLEQGRAINRYRDQLIAATVATSALVQFGDLLIRAANCPYSYASDVAGELAKASPSGVGLYWFDDLAGGQRHFGLRSTPDGPDVASLAERHGGGGHKHAAGFRVRVGDPLSSVWPTGAGDE